MDAFSSATLPSRLPSSSRVNLTPSDTQLVVPQPLRLSGPHSPCPLGPCSRLGDTTPFSFDGKRVLALPRISEDAMQLLKDPCLSLSVHGDEAFKEMSAFLSSGSCDLSDSLFDEDTARSFVRDGARRRATP